MKIVGRLHAQPLDLCPTWLPPVENKFKTEMAPVFYIGLINLRVNILLEKCYRLMPA